MITPSKTVVADVGSSVHVIAETDNFVDKRSLAAIAVDKSKDELKNALTIVSKNNEF